MGYHKYQSEDEEKNFQLRPRREDLFSYFQSSRAGFVGMIFCRVHLAVISYEPSH